MTPEQKQRIEQIREQVQRLERAEKDPHVKTWDGAYYGDVHFLLSLVKSQEASGRSAQEIAADIVREWSEHDMNEHYGSDYLADEFGAGHLEERIATAITNATASMHATCVEEVKDAGVYHDSQCSCVTPAHGPCNCGATKRFNKLVTDLGSISIQG